jgi:hypothetical protein
VGSVRVPQWLISLKGDTILVGISKGFITLPDDPETPIICVGPGTGVAPMRAIIQHRLKLGAKCKIFLYTSTSFRGSLKDHLFLPPPQKKKATRCILAVGPQQKTSTTPLSGKITSNSTVLSTNSPRPVMAQRVSGGPTSNTSLNKTRSTFGMWLARGTGGCTSQGNHHLHGRGNGALTDRDGSVLGLRTKCLRL